MNTISLDNTVVMSTVTLVNTVALDNVLGACNRKPGKRINKMSVIKITTVVVMIIVMVNVFVIATRRDVIGVVGRGRR